MCNAVTNAVRRSVQNQNQSIYLNQCQIVEAVEGSFCDGLGL